MKRWVAIHTGLPHYLDHLGVLSINLNLPLLVTEKKSFEIAVRYYPHLSVKFIDLRDLTLEYLASHFDVIFESGHLWAAELVPLFELFFKKKMRIVYCPHGNSDKKVVISKRLSKDISLLYGHHMFHLLHQTGELQKLHGYVFTGNYRLQHYLNHQSLYDALFLEAMQGKFISHKKWMLYAPSWSHKKDPSSFVFHCEKVIQEVGVFYHLIIKWHPFLYEDYPGHIEYLLGKYEKLQNLSFLHDFPCIYPILNHVEGYIGDFSSIGYDALALNKPLYFLDHHDGDIYNSGILLSLKKHLGRSIYEEQKQDRFEKKRKKLCEYVFGETKESTKIESEIKRALSQERTL